MRRKSPLCANPEHTNCPGPCDKPLPDRPLTALEVNQARHTMLHVAQECQGLRTALGTMFARSDQRQLVMTERVRRSIGDFCEELLHLQKYLGGPPGPAAPKVRTDMPEGSYERYRDYFGKVVECTVPVTFYSPEWIAGARSTTYLGKIVAHFGAGGDVCLQVPVQPGYPNPGCMVMRQEMKLRVLPGKLSDYS